MAVKLASHPNTRPAPLEIPIYAKLLKSEQKMTETQGRPFFEVLVNTLGALPTKARPSLAEVSQQDQQ